MVVLGVPAVVLTLIHLTSELQRQEHTLLFAAVVVVGSLAFLAGLAFAYRGSTLGAVAVGVLAFGELALQLSSHFAAGPLALSGLAPTEGIWFSVVVFFLAATCLLTLAVVVADLRAAPQPVRRLPRPHPAKERPCLCPDRSRRRGASPLRLCGRDRLAGPGLAARSGSRGSASDPQDLIAGARGAGGSVSRR